MGQEEACLPSGHALLDAQLPGGGWPVGGMTELLQAQPGPHVWQLLLPVLTQATGQGKGPVVLVGAPFVPYLPSLAAQGLPADRLLCVRAEKPAALLWSTEQCLRCAEVVAVLAWLPRARSAELRRLQMAAQQHDKLFFVFRGLEMRNDASPARLRLQLEGVDPMEVHIFKRKGPPLPFPVLLPARSARLAALLQARQKKPGAEPPAPLLPNLERSHVLDRTAALT
ncbi:MAG: translesion DNA synthesis-associated protein ImuA [Comamonadaceae bacterium]|nr:MAG: translesion DNA synthesis-associated protein ImuA [Comamonadaceae bacterium]